METQAARTSFYEDCAVYEPLAPFERLYIQSYGLNPSLAGSLEDLRSKPVDEAVQECTALLVAPKSSL